MTKTLVAGCLVVLSGCASTVFTRGEVTVRQFTHDSMNTFLVTKGGASFLVDSGLEKHAGLIEADVRAAGVDPKDLKAIVITHGHADHAGSAALLRTKFGVPVIAGAGDGPMIAAGKNEKLCPTGFLANTRIDTDQNATFTGYAPDELLTAPKTLSGFDAVVTPLPGHTSGSLVVTIGDVAIVGDLFRGSLVGSGAATHLYMCDLEQNKKDVKRLLTELAPGAKVFFVGHFGPVERDSVASHFDVGP
jgi:glyoxylase-like metal-dependent hydrolase (beta-lactamase superfamily II)